MVKNKLRLKDKLLVGFQSRFNPIITKIKEEIKSKKGKLFTLDFTCGQNIKVEPGTDYKKEFAYGKMDKNKKFVWELSHDLDLVIFLGKPCQFMVMKKNCRI